MKVQNANGMSSLITAYVCLVEMNAADCRAMGANVCAFVDASLSRFFQIEEHSTSKNAQ
jgi:hypothetical protein